MGLKVDQYGLVRAGTDGGDECQRTFSVLLLTYLLYKYGKTDGSAYNNALQVGPSKAFRQLNPQPGLYIRSPDGDWTSGLRTASRDQLTPVMCFLAAWGTSDSETIRNYARNKMKELIVACLKRGMFAQNDLGNNGEDPSIQKWKVPDFINPDLWAILAMPFVKSYWAPVALLAILFGDIFSVFGALLKVFSPRTPDGALWPLIWNDPDSVDDTNINNAIATRQYKYSTPFSWLTRKIYKKFRKTNYGVTNLGEISNVMGAIAWYNRNDNTDITELHRPLVEKY